MVENKRIKKAINWLISQDKFASQKEIGIKLGITNRSYLSQLVNSESPSKEFVNKFTEIAPEISSLWLLTGEGEMLRKDAAPAPALSADPAAMAERIRLLELMVEEKNIRIQELKERIQELKERIQELKNI